MKVVLEETAEIANGVWLAAVPPHQILMFGAPRNTGGRTSVLIVGAGEFQSEKQGQLTFDAEDTIVLNHGRTPRLIVVEGGNDQPLAGAQSIPSIDPTEFSLGPGDREFLSLVERELDGEAKEAAKALLKAVRGQYPGDLKRGLRNNFSNTPDNFWYVIVQPRVNGLSITVRGEPKRFLGSGLDVRVDRPGYTRFAINRNAEVAEAIRIIEQARRKRPS